MPSTIRLSRVGLGAIAARFGDGPIDASIHAIPFTGVRLGIDSPVSHSNIVIRNAARFFDSGTRLSITACCCGKSDRKPDLTDSDRHLSTNVVTLSSERIEEPSRRPAPTGARAFKSWSRPALEYGVANADLKPSTPLEPFPLAIRSR